VEEGVSFIAEVALRSNTALARWSRRAMPALLVVALLAPFAAPGAGHLWTMVGPGRARLPPPLEDQGLREVELFLDSKGPPRCASKDHNFLMELQKGESQSFFSAVALCSKRSISWFFSFDRQTFISCMQEGKYHALSEPCLGCYGMNGQYALDNCKYACLASWCSSACLECSSRNNKAFSACSGRPISEMPQPMTC